MYTGGENEVESLLPLLRFKANRMTQLEFSKEIGVGASTVYQWEKNVGRMTVEKLVEVCEYFDITPNEFLMYEKSEEHE